MTMALSPPLEEPLSVIREALAPLRSGLSVALHTPGNAFAVGAIVRICHSFLVRDIILIGNEPYYEKASMGMHRFENIVRVLDEHMFFDSIQGRPVWALEREWAQRSLYEIREFPKDLVLVAGSERDGLSQGFLKRCDDVVAIPLYGINNSLPVTVAVGIALSCWARAYYQPGAVVVGPRR